LGLFREEELMIYLALPVGSSHGWGVCGKYLTRELSALTEVSLLTEPFELKDIGDEFDYALLKSKCLTGDCAALPLAPALQSIGSAALAAYRPRLAGQPTVGYTFFEDNLTIARYVDEARHRYDTIVAGSRWCEQVLRHYGFDSVSTILQGVDSTIFHPHANERDYLKDAFVVFSGGKFEFRKGQDLVIRAFKVLQDRHRDVVLVNAWHNFWQFSIQTMCASPYIQFRPGSGAFGDVIGRLLSDAGIRPEQVITLGPRPNPLMARIYRNTDVGLFPNRCEGGTNLVLMEYMACGKPVIASYSTGHKDVLSMNNSIWIKSMKPLIMRGGSGDAALWDDPDLDETIDRLEWAYQNRDHLEQIGRQAANDMLRLTWRSSAEQFHRVLTSGPENLAGANVGDPAAVSLY
jgi:glycosyltransferase involved in cell wall biosynthesis